MRRIIKNQLIANVTIGVLLASLLAFVSCGDENEFKGFEVNLEDAEAGVLAYPADGGIKQVKLNSSEDWTAESSAEWCMVSPANGKAGTTCEIRVDSSYVYGPDSRKATITFHSGAITKQVELEQQGYDKIISATTDLEGNLPDFALPDKAKFEVVVKANVKFKVEILDNVTWVSCKEFTQKQSVIPREYKLQFNYDPSMVNSERAVKIRFVPSDKADETVQPAELEVKQDAAPKIEDNRRGDSLALVALARGLQCYNSWDHSRSMIHWYGVTMKDFPLKTADGKKDSSELRVVGVSLLVFKTKQSLPAEVKYLKKLESLSLVGNENHMRLRIELGPEITELKNLKSLKLNGYGISSVCDEMKNMTSLETLDLSGNTMLQLPREVIEHLHNNGKLRNINFSGNRRKDGIIDLPLQKEVRDTIGLGGQMSDYEWLFKLDRMKSITLSYNYIEGTIPDMKSSSKPILPNCRSLHINLNRLTGNLPDWMLTHPHLCGWDPFTLVFTQEGKDSNGRISGFDNEPSTTELDCTNYDWSETDDAEKAAQRGIDFTRYVKGYR